MINNFYAIWDTGGTGCTATMPQYTPFCTSRDVCGRCICVPCGTYNGRKAKSRIPKTGEGGEIC